MQAAGAGELGPEMLPFHLIYHEDYDLHLGNHVFPSQKFRLIRERLLSEGFAAPEDFVTPEPASDEDLMLVHERGWVQRLKTGAVSYEEILQLEIPYSPEMVRAFWLAAGGTTLAARMALQQGVCFNVGGGFHHAFPDHGEGFCAINDIAVSIRKLQRDGKIRRAMVVDCDVHHGNGTATIFAGDASVFTLSIHQYNNYPVWKPPSSVDVHLSDGTGDEEYLERLSAAYRFPLTGFHPDLLVYVAGADPYRYDQLGGLALTLEGLKRRDRLVIQTALRHGTAVAIVLAGGYAADLKDTVTIHSNTASVAKEALDAVGWKV
jgi:acetoin utilization deacetylase AcuC-like enzyme